MPVVETSVDRQLIRRIVVFSLLIIVAAIATSVFTVMGERPANTATVRILVDVDDFTNTSLADRYLGTLEVITTSHAATARIADHTGIGRGTIERALAVETLPDSSVMEITATHQRSETALAIVEAAAALLTETATNDRDATVLGTLEDQAATLREGLAEVDDALGSIRPGDSITAREERLLAESEDLLDRITDLEEQIFEYRVDAVRDTTRATPLGAARATAEATTRSLMRAVAFGAFIGIVLAAVTAAGLWMAAGRGVGAAGAEAADDGSTEDVT